MLSFKTIVKHFSPSKGVRGVYESRAGNRDMVGHGCNGQPAYKDDAHFPFPSIRFKENTKVIKPSDGKLVTSSMEDIGLLLFSYTVLSYIQALREKEKGDWKELSKSEKKALYRASFCQTFVEFQHPTGQWKAVLGGLLFCTSLAFWMQIFYCHYVSEPLPWSVSEDAQKAQLQRMLDLQVNPIDGISSNWDYDEQKWKK